MSKTIANGLYSSLCRTNLSPRDTINAFVDGRFDVQEAIRVTDELLGTNAMDACEP